MGLIQGDLAVHARTPRRVIASMKSIIVGAILLLGLAAWGQQNNTAYPRRLSVPKHYGKFVAVYSDQLLFEAEDGTIRSVYPNGGKVIFEIRR